MRTLVIVLEGIDGVGKSSQARILKEKLTGIGVQAVVLHFPSEKGEIGKEIRKMLKDKRFDKLQPRARTLLTVADFFNEYQKYKDFDGVIIFDRYWHSNLASNSGENGITDEWIIAIHQGAPIPALVFFLECHPFEIAKREGADFGVKDTERQLRLKSRYEAVFAKHECVRIDASASKSRVSEAIWKCVKKKFLNDQNGAI